MKGAKVIVSYAKEDQARALELYRALKQAGEIPWIDSSDILPGELWELAIQRAIKAADVVVILLSSVSVKKRGFLQREIHDALELWKEKLEDDIFVIPVRLDDCVPPVSLSRFQWVDLWTSDGLTRLLDSIRAAHNRKLAESTCPAVGETTIRQVELSDRNTKPPRFNASVSFPRYINTREGGDLERANAIIATAASDALEAFIRKATEARPIPRTRVG